MRAVLITLACTFVLAVASPARLSATAVPAGPSMSAATSSVYALQIPDKKIEITVGDRGGGGVRWYRSPVWIAIGVLAAVVVLLMIVLIARGGGTTIVKD
jgi:hypothetical protein